MPIHVHKNIASLVPYSPGKPLDELEREFGISNAVKLASNENSLGPSPKAQAVLAEHISQLNVYPEGGAHYLRRALAARWKVDPAQIVVGNGSDEVISLLVRAFVAPGEEAVMADDTFVMYKLAVQGGHGVPIEVSLKDWRHDLPSMARAITDKTRLVFVCNPNNPTGTMVSKGEVDAFMEAVPDDVIVVFDEAYYEYVRSTEYPESLQYVKQNRPVVVLRTFSKIYGLAGLRVGYGISTLEIMDYVNRVRPPFNSNCLAQAAALAALDDEEHVAKSRAMNTTEMGVLEKELTKMGLSPIPSQANFIYFDTKRDGRQVFDALLRKGVIVRHIKGPMIRVTVGQAFENQRFLEALQDVLIHSG